MKHLFFLAMMLFTTQSFASGVDLEKSQLNWKGTKVTGELGGTIGLTSATLDVVGGVIKSGELVASIDSITVGDLNGEFKDKFLTHMKSPDFFDARNTRTPNW